ncbi:formylmethanofuran dehydrogenase subunit A [Schlesneria paludicola]|uniref:formylmethanofuran dehydrogenase subunit A n=1 Tax=Schlesneria paludicola TaxID=360056 RepID=UPI00029AF4B9|nr:formylmethanofuran dehydrogenase subunit A [Schlesneria paludicola]
MSLLLVRNGTIYDPRHGVDGVQRDLWISGGRIIEAPADTSIKPDRVIDATGMVVMAGGVDMHCHIAGPKVNSARKMLPGDRRRAKPYRRTAIARSGTIGSVPSTFATGYLYAGLGYTTAFDAAIPPLAARHAHEEFADTPQLDKGFLVLAGNNHYVMQQLRNAEPQLVKAYLGWLLNATKGYGIKVVNPGGVENWKCRANGNVKTLDDTVDGFHIRPRDILRGVATAVDELGLPHSVHIHCNNLGLPGNWSTTLETMRALEGQRGHLTHIQFHSYGGDPDDQSTFRSEVPQLADYVNSHSNLTVDVGQVMFGETVSMTGDGPLGYYLHKVTGRKWFSGDIEQEAGCGIVPITYKEKSFVHALQWAVGLEWYLLVDDPWRIAMSTDHPNGASFLAYPQIIALLMDRTRRQDVLNRLPARIRDATVLGQLERQYSLYEIAIITRAAPAKMLGLTRKGHLGPGADADITIYTPDADYERMFELPRYVLKAGEILIEQGEMRKSVEGTTLQTAPDFDAGALPSIREWFDSRYSIQFRNYSIDADEYAETVVEPTISGA